jgi:hypothetical protein
VIVLFISGVSGEVAEIENFMHTDITTASMLQGGATDARFERFLPKRLLD